MYPLPHLSLHLLHFPLCWPHSRQAHCPHGGHQHFLAGPQACPVQPTLKRGHLFPGSSGKHTLIHFHWLPGVHAFCRSKLCGQGGGKEQADRSPPLVGLSPLGGGQGGVALRRKRVLSSRRVANSGLGTNPLVFNTETTQGVPRNVCRRGCGPGEPHHPTLGPELARRREGPRRQLSGR